MIEERVSERWESIWSSVNFVLVEYPSKVEAFFFFLDYEDRHWIKEMLNKRKLKKKGGWNFDIPPTFIWALG